MKINRKQLRQAIESVMINEGFFGDISDKMNFGATVKELLKNSSQDAFDILEACKGIGTDEEKIQNVIEKRINNLHELYIEFHNLIVNYTKANTGFKSSDQELMDENFNQDLIAWLEEDGMDEEAVLVEEAIAMANMQRKEVPLAVQRGMF